MNKKKTLIVLSLVAGAIGARQVRADALDRVGEGATLYGELRPVALAGALKRLGLDSLPAVQRLRQQFGGLDVFDPALLAPTGLDVASPIAVSVEFSPLGAVTHARLVATLRDASMFRTFLGAVSATGQLPLKPAAVDSPEGRLGVLATAVSPSGNVSAVARVDGESLIVDAAIPWGGKALPAAEVARRYPVEVKTPFVPGRGARRLFASDTAVAVYADGRRFAELLEAVYREDLEDDLKAAKKSERAALKLKRLATMKKCLADWSHAPSTFDDVGLALSADPREVRLTLGWGTLGETPMNGLRFSPVDDGGVDVDFLARQAPVVAALFAASASPFSSLKHTGIYQSLSTVTEFGKRCGDQVNVGIALRGWPLVAAAGLSELNKPSTTQSSGLDLSSALSMFGQLRNVVVVVRDATTSSAQFALSATFDAQARTVLESVLAIFGGGGTAKTIAPKRTPMVYSISNPSLGSFVGALETLPKGQVMFTFADSDESLQLAYRKATMMPGAVTSPRGGTPILALHLDGGMVAKLATNAGAGENAKPALDLMARLSRVDADLAGDGDLFRFTLRAPLKK